MVAWTITGTWGKRLDQYCHACPNYAASRYFAGSAVGGGAVVVSGTAPRARSAPSLLPQSQLADDHGAIGRLAHVIDREGRHGARRQRLHLHPGSVDRFHLGLHPDVVVADS